MFKKKALILLLPLLFLPTVLAECPKYTHVLSPNYESDLLIFSGLYLDVNKKDFQNTVNSDPSGLITMNVEWEWGPSCKACTVNVNAFGDWSENELAKLFSGIKGDSGQMTTTASFRAPNETGNYTLRVIFLVGQKGLAPSFDISKSCIDCVGECHVFYADGTIIVSPPLSNDSVPPAVRITSPSFSAVLSKSEIVLGENVLIDAQVSDPLANVLVDINGVKVKGFPYLWNTSNLTPDEYKIEVVAVDLAGNIGSDEITVGLIEKSGPLKPSLAWSREEVDSFGDLDVSRDGSLIGAAIGKSARIYDARGNELEKYNLNNTITALALSSDGNQIAAGTGNKVIVLKNRSIIWTYTAPETITALALSSDGNQIAAGTGNKVIVLDVVGKNLTRNFSFSGKITSISPTEDFKEIVISTNESVNLYTDGELLWKRSAFDVKNALIDPKGNYFAYSSVRNLLFYSLKAETIEKPRPGFLERRSFYLLIIATVLVLLIVGLRFRKAKVVLPKEEAPSLPVAKRLAVQVFNQTGAPVVDAIVRYGNVEKKTSVAGEATFESIAGEYTIVVEKPLYSTKSEPHVFSGKEETLKVLLASSISLSDGQLEKINRIKIMIDKSLQEVSFYDRCLPDYYHSTASRFVAFVELLPSNPEYFDGRHRDYGTIIDNLIDVIFIVCESISNVMVDWKNVQIYKASTGLKPSECKADELDEEFYRSLVALIKNPSEYLRHGTLTAKNMLVALDKKISGKMGELTILPVTGLWGVAKKLTEDSSLENELHGGIMTLLAIQVLRYADDMFNKPGIVERLKRTIV